MKNKNYYLDLADRWFDALLTSDEERELLSFLVSTNDPDFDEAKAVAGFFATGKALSKNESKERTLVIRRRIDRFRWVAGVAVAASIVLLVTFGLYHRNEECYVMDYGKKTTDPQLALESMNVTLTDIFSEGETVGEQLLDLFNPAI